MYFCDISWRNLAVIAAFYNKVREQAREFKDWW
jgi:hypothetical protein